MRSEKRELLKTEKLACRILAKLKHDGHRYDDCYYNRTMVFIANILLRMTGWANAEAFNYWLWRRNGYEPKQGRHINRQLRKLRTGQKL